MMTNSLLTLRRASVINHKHVTLCR